jgi:hypothetical protein
MGGDGLAQDGVVARERIGHRLDVLLPPLRTAFDVGEKEGDGAAFT